MKKALFFFCAAIAAAFTASCSSDDKEPETTKKELSTAITISGKVKKTTDSTTVFGTDHAGTITIDPVYGSLQPDFTAKDMLERGFEFGDLLKVKIGNLPELIMPFVTAYTQAGNMGLSCCNYNATGGVVDFGIANGNFHERVGGNEGDAITVTVYQKHGYKEIFDLIPSVYKMERADFATDEIYANFREVKTTGMKSGILYRSSNPLNLKKNPGRYIYVDKLAEKVGVKTEIDLADTENDVKEYIASADYKANYCKTLFENGNTVTLGMSADVFSKDFMAKAARGFRFMIEHEGPYLVHCNEGKDRCGFIIMLLEGLSGATINELRSDYMVTFENYYNMQSGTKSYDTNLLLTGDRNIWVLANPEVLNDYVNINWNAMSLNGINLQQSVINYMKDCGLNTDEISQLKARLTK